MNTQHHTTIRKSISRWLIAHTRAIKNAMHSCIHAPFSYFITIVVIGIALALPIGFLILLKNAQSIETVWQTSSPSISLYLKPDITDPQTQVMIQKLQENSEISHVSYISADQGFALLKNNTVLSDAIKLFQKNPLPSVIVVTPKMHNPNHMQTLYSTLKLLPLVDVAQIDMNWATRLYDLILIGKKMVDGLSILFGLGVVFIIGHALRSSLSSHLKEIQVMKLVGATHGYIRRPLLYRGVFYGVSGGLIALLLVNLFFSQLKAPVLQFSETYHRLFQFQMLSISADLSILLLAGALGWVSAWIISTQFLKMPEEMESL